MRHQPTYTLTWDQVLALTTVIQGLSHFVITGGGMSGEGDFVMTGRTRTGSTYRFHGDAAEVLSRLLANLPTPKQEQPRYPLCQCGCGNQLLPDPT